MAGSHPSPAEAGIDIRAAVCHAAGVLTRLAAGVVALECPAFGLGFDEINM